MTPCPMTQERRNKGTLPVLKKNHDFDAVVVIVSIIKIRDGSVRKVTGPTGCMIGILFPVEPDRLGIHSYCLLLRRDALTLAVWADAVVGTYTVHRTLTVTVPNQWIPGSHGSTVSIVGRSGFDPRQGQRIVLLAPASRLALGPTQPPIQRVPGDLSPGVKPVGAWLWSLTPI
jgi:hypothetical protein